MFRFRSLLILCLFPIHCCFAVIRYVNVNNPTPGGGTSWATAFTDLSAAIAAAREGDDIWVARGIYKPTGVGRNATFFMTDGFYVYGGFDGTETTVTQRNPTVNQTILSGDLGVPGDPSDNSYHVVTLYKIVNGYFMDGFTIRDGSANAGVPSLTPQPDNTGGGVLFLAQANDLSYGLVRNCVLTNNTAVYGGGVGSLGNGVGAQARYGVTNCIFNNNRAQIGGAIAGLSLNGDWGEGEIQNCIFTNNLSVMSKGSVLAAITDNPGSNYSTNFTNNTLYDNQAPVLYNQQTGGTSYIFTGNDIVWQSGGPYASVLNVGPNSDFYDSDLDLASPAGGNLAVDPQFVNEAGNDFHLKHCSPVVDKGTSIPLTFNYDMDNGARKQGNEIDMGAYESALPLYPGVADVTYCQNATANPLTATADAGNTLLWYANYTGGIGNPTAPTPATNRVATEYFYVSQVDATGCEGLRITTRAIITAGPAVPAATGVTYCLNDVPSTLTAIGTSLLWYTDPVTGVGSATAPMPSTAASGVTTYYVTQTIGCESQRKAVTVTVNAPPAAPVAASPTYCLQATATALTATGSSLLWYTDPATGTGSGTAPVPSTATSGTTTYYVSQTSGCESLRTPVSVTVYASPLVAVQPVTGNICPGNTVNLNASGAATYQWDPVTNLSDATINNPAAQVQNDIVYTVTGTDANGCTATAQVTLKIGTGCSAGNGGNAGGTLTGYNFPNAFSPNRDGRNDVLRVKTGDVPKSFSLLIFNRYGQKVFESRDVNKSWDGMLAGQVAEPGAYVYVMVITTSTGTVIKNKGTLMLMR
ncbi:hypothetical protein A4H97_28215 [Niastella yeongjuensis]|uniref:Ig-like domain-containing protein n=1 Tax=Niastella yeongjuensis TaxID=354355 RepID=A0A1V9EUE6_9BACT|nr:gliding motility-associated C-terminal domain-containing protein [Niastella yeongjuensis]OQP49778.1 hypothetical protein A4H97_28215 [Niastella yeongjuensis]SEP40416.1 gliding motility-associated C-terminal domain-containing protein [Niastella yeongjuensis]